MLDQNKKTAHPNPGSTYIHGNSWEDDYYYMGLLLAKAIILKVPVAVDLSIILLKQVKQLLNFDFYISDLEFFDNGIYASFTWMLKTNLKQIMIIILCLIRLMQKVDKKLL